MPILLKMICLGVLNKIFEMQPKYYPLIFKE